MISLDKDEHIIFQIRKHWFVFAVKIAVIVLFALAPLLLVFVFKNLLVSIVISNGSLVALVCFLYSTWLLILWLVSFIFWTDYFLDVWIVTDRKLVDVDQQGLFRREISILHLDKIQDVTSEVDGILATFINYGDIHVQTAGQQREFVIEHVPRPNEVRQRLNDALMRYKEVYLTEAEVKSSGI